MFKEDYAKHGSFELLSFAQQEMAHSRQQTGVTVEGRSCPPITRQIIPSWIFKSLLGVPWKILPGLLVFPMDRTGEVYSCWGRPCGLASENRHGDFHKPVALRACQAQQELLNVGVLRASV